MQALWILCLIFKERINLIIVYNADSDVGSMYTNIIIPENIAIFHLQFTLNAASCFLDNKENIKQ